MFLENFSISSFFKNFINFIWGFFVMFRFMEILGGIFNFFFSKLSWKEVKVVFLFVLCSWIIVIYMYSFKWFIFFLYFIENRIKIGLYSSWIVIYVFRDGIKWFYFGVFFIVWNICMKCNLSMRCFKMYVLNFFF